MKLIIKGFIIGLGKILPGISGAMLAMSLGEYNKIINTIATLKQNTMEKTKYLSKIGIGITLAIILTSNIIVNCLNKNYFATILLFLGVIIGGIPNIIKQTKYNIKDIIMAILCIGIMIIISKIFITKKEYQINYNIIDFTKLILVGTIDAISSIIPGISGTALLLSIGYYKTIINTFANITQTHMIKQNIFVMTPFIIGFLLGTIIISKIINKIIEKNKNLINILVITFMIYTTYTLIISTIKPIKNTTEIVEGIMLLVISTIITNKISNKKKTN